MSFKHLCQTMELSLTNSLVTLQRGTACTTQTFAWWHPHQFPGVHSMDMKDKSAFIQHWLNDGKQVIQKEPASTTGVVDWITATPFLFYLLSHRSRGWFFNSLLFLNQTRLWVERNSQSSELETRLENWPEGQIHWFGSGRLMRYICRAPVTKHND